MHHHYRHLDPAREDDFHGLSDPEVDAQIVEWTLPMLLAVAFSVVGFVALVLTLLLF
jgi:hypothetical protein